MQVSGKIKLIRETQTIGSSGFRKRELILTTEEQYPQQLSIEFVQDKCDVLNNFSQGQDVTISINLRGREWINPEGEAKYFNSIQGWKIEGGASSESSVGSNGSSSNDEPDDLPF